MQRGGYSLRCESLFASIKKDCHHRNNNKCFLSIKKLKESILQVQKT
jgi:hypothetical protein